MPTRRLKGFKFRYGFWALLCLILLTALFSSWFVRHRNHVNAIAALRQAGAEVLWQRRDIPTWLDQQLGVWRFDDVEAVHCYGKDFDLKPIQYLKSVEHIDCDMSVKDSDYRPLFKHVNTLQFLWIYDWPKQPEPELFFRRFKTLKILWIMEAEIANVGGLLECQQLEQLRLMNCKIAEEELQRFRDLPRSVKFNCIWDSGHKYDPASRN